MCNQKTNMFVTKGRTAKTMACVFIKISGDVFTNIQIESI